MPMDIYIRDEKSSKLRNLQLAQIELIRTFAKICEKEGLIYYMLGGTMLGAIRHKGYIPWDDDADFGMPRKDYEVFMNVASKYMPDGERLAIFNGTDDYNFFLRLENTRTKVAISGVTHEHILNTWIDIFPLDGMPENAIFRILHKVHLLLLRKAFRLSVFDKEVKLNLTHRAWYNRLGVCICTHIPLQRLFSPIKMWKYLDGALKAYPYEKSSWNLNLMGAYKFRELFPQSVFGEGNFYDFEGMQLRGPKDYEIYLTQLYGDYMTPPPESERGSKHNIEFVEDVNVESIAETCVGGY